MNIIKVDNLGTYDSDLHQFRHSAPAADSGCPAYCLDKLISDVYSTKYMPMYFKTRFIRNIVNSLHNNPDAMVTVYRGVPGRITSINDGDWCSVSREYAEEYAGTTGNLLIISIPARWLYWDGNDEHEFGVDSRVLDNDYIK